MKAVLAFFRIYNSFGKNACLAMLAYRMRYVTGILTYLLFVSVHYFIWNAVFAGRPVGTVINGFTLPQMITYIAIGWSARSLYFSNIDYEIEEQVRSGQISIHLIRPVNFQLMMMFQAMGESVFRALFFTVPVAAAILLIFPVSAPANFSNFILFALSSVAGFLIMAELNFIIGLLAFPLKSVQGIIRAKYYLLQLCSGLLLPLTFFPPWAQQVLDFLPFKIITYIPLQFYLGKIATNQILDVFITQFIWISVLGLTGHLCWQKALSRLTVQGG